MKNRGLLFLLALASAGCTKHRGNADYRGYPDEVGEILVSHCATPGCHNPVSKDVCVGLDISSWENLFKGGRNNSSVIPYRPDLSFLLYSVNTYDDLGPKLEPVMPFGRPHFTRSQVETLRDWIAAGAPDKNGYIKWSENPERRKIYVANQGCDQISVFDAETRLMMRVFDAGILGSTEAPHDMYVSPDGQHLYILFFKGNLFQKFRTSDNIKTGELNLGELSWHSMSISGDSKFALASHLAADGKVALMDLTTMTLAAMYQGSGFMVYPHGNTMSYDGKLAYVTCQQGNFLYKLDLTDPQNPDVQQIVLNPGDVPSTSGIYKPYDVEFSPDYSKYYVSCQGTNELRIFQASNDSLLQVIPTSGVPQVMAFSSTQPYVFVPCMGDTANPNAQSSVNIINLNTNQLVKSLYTGQQPRSCVVDDKEQVVWVANRNISGVGWAPHHSTACEGRNGYITLISLKTLDMIPGWKCEVTVDPYHITIRN